MLQHDGQAKKGRGVDEGIIEHVDCLCTPPQYQSPNTHLLWKHAQLPFWTYAFNVSDLVLLLLCRYLSCELLRNQISQYLLNMIILSVFPITLKYIWKIHSLYILQVLLLLIFIMFNTYPDHFQKKFKRTVSGKACGRNKRRFLWGREILGNPGLSFSLCMKRSI